LLLACREIVAALNLHKNLAEEILAIPG